MERLTEKFKDGRNILRKGVSDVFHVGFGRFFEGEAIDRLAEYEDLEEQGKLLKLDDKYQKLIIGQEVWMIIGGNAVKQANISRISESWSDLYGFQGEYTAIPETGRGGWDLKYDEFGKTVFLTKEEAEVALKEL